LYNRDILFITWAYHVAQCWEEPLIIAIEIRHIEQALADLKNVVQFLERCPINGGEALAMLNATSRVRAIGTSMEQTGKNLDIEVVPAGQPDSPSGESEGR